MRADRRWVKEEKRQADLPFSLPCLLMGEHRRDVVIAPHPFEGRLRRLFARQFHNPENHPRAKVRMPAARFGHILPEDEILSR